MNLRMQKLKVFILLAVAFSFLPSISYATGLDNTLKYIPHIILLGSILFFVFLYFIIFGNKKKKS